MIAKQIIVVALIWHNSFLEAKLDDMDLRRKKGIVKQELDKFKKCNLITFPGYAYVHYFDSLYSH